MIPFENSVLAGYQGWFATPRNPFLRRWSHWSRTGTPAADTSAFELYPALSEYPLDSLTRTDYANLGTGEVARLFDSDHENVVNVHVRWMDEYKLNGPVLQRFVVGLGGNAGQWRNSVTHRLKGACERLKRSLYVMYDISGYSGNDLVGVILRDFSRVLVDDLELLESPSYVRQNDRPVVAIWGFGFENRPGTPDELKRLIRELRETHGCYVVGGVPYYFRRDESQNDKDWLEAFKMFDMVLPWSVGRYRTPDEVAQHYEALWKDDKAFCDAEGIALQRVIYPGFAWSNLKSHQRIAPERAQSRYVSDAAFAPQNEIPRLAGEFFWAQAYYVSLLGTGAFIAMFDEFDEATAIAKAAKNAREIPTDAYFLTLDADGVRVSSDFYLRLAGEATDMIEGRSPVTDTIPIDLVPDPDQGARDVQIAHGYRALLGREPDARGRAAYHRHFASGGTVLEFCQSLTNSDEFALNRSDITPEAWADELYLNILERDPDPGGRLHTIREVRAGRLADRAAAMLESPEFYARFV